jgi:hypothetical protein
MGLTVSQSASIAYNISSLESSDSYKKYAVDSSSVTKEDYNVSNLASALDALGKTDTADFSSISNIDGYAKSVYSISQLSEYEAIRSDTTVSNAEDLLTNSTDLSGLYDSLGTYELMQSTSESVWKTYYANAESETTDGSSCTGSILDTLV